MNTSFEPNDELCRLWQELGRPLSDKEKHKIMELVETRAKTFERIISQRNIVEYTVAVVMAVVCAFLASQGLPPLERAGYAFSSAACLWVILFMWLMQRPSQGLLLESPGEVYKKALLAKYDRQIVLTRTAWAWYVLPLATGQVIASVGDNHAAEPFGLVRAGVILSVGVVIAFVNWKASRMLTAEKQDLRQLLEETE